MKTELTVHAVHEGGMRVLACDGEFQVAMDYPMAADESTAGPTPLTMLLASLAACSLNSVVVILRKMQQPLAGLSVEARGTRRTEHPTVLTDISLAFKVRGGVDPAAIARGAATIGGAALPGMEHAESEHADQGGIPRTTGS